MIVALLPQTRKCTYLIPYSVTSMSAFLHRNSIIQEEEYEGRYKITAIVNDEVYNKCKNSWLRRIYVKNNTGILKLALPAVRNDSLHDDMGTWHYNGWKT